MSEADNEPSDGKFEVILFPDMPKWRVLLTAMRATTQGLGDQPGVSSYELTTLKPLRCQIDGEVKSVDANTRVGVDCAPAALPILGQSARPPFGASGIKESDDFGHLRQPLS